VSEPSSYLDYLPAALWRGESGSPAPDIALGDMLRIFEKVLTGIPDDAVLAHDDHIHEAITAEIDHVHRVFDPWTTPASFLQWLAAAVALEFPTLRNAELWSEYQRRKAIAAIARLYRIRGGKQGLLGYLGIFAPGRTRIAVDDGARLLSVTPSAGGQAVTAAMVSPGPVVVGQEVRLEGLTRPWSVAAGADSLFVADIGLPDGLPVQVRNRVWRLGPGGGYMMSGAPPQPRPVAPDALPLSRVVGVAVRPAAGAAPETLYVLDRPGQLYEIPAPFSTVRLVTTLPGATPVAMALDPANGSLLVLDRGAGAGAAAAPRIAAVQPSSATVTTTRLRTIVEPLSLAVEPDGTLLVGDGGVQRPTSPSQWPGNVVRIDRTPAPWAETQLLPADNPLVAPTGIARTRDGRLYLLDAGLKPFLPAVAFPFISPVAEPASVFRIDPGGTPPAARITRIGELVYPTGLTALGSQLVVCDPGQPPSGWPLIRPELKLSRVRPFEFDVIVHFVERFMPADQDQRRQVARQVLGNVRAVVEREKPAHTRFNLISS